MEQSTQSNSTKEEFKEKRMTVLFKKQSEKSEEEISNEKLGRKVVNTFLNPVVIMLLWNWLMPGLFGLATIGYLKAFGLYIMSRILFGNHEQE